MTYEAKFASFKIVFLVSICRSKGYDLSKSKREFITNTKTRKY